jgi:hypothetical protein
MYRVKKGVSRKLTIYNISCGRSILKEKTSSYRSNNKDQDKHFAVSALIQSVWISTWLVPGTEALPRCVKTARNIISRYRYLMHSLVFDFFKFCGRIFFKLLEQIPMDFPCIQHFLCKHLFQKPTSNQILIKN